MCKILFSFLLFCSQSLLFSSPSSQKEYFALIDQYPNLVFPRGDASKGEIEIILDRDKIQAIEQRTGRDVGIMKKDAYWIWVNDACLFPGGREGVYGRILWIKSLEGTPAIAVMPILPDGRIVLNCNYRHATRSWEIELARGLVDPSETTEEAVKRESEEETGMLLDQVFFLGDITPDNGVEGTSVSIFAATVFAKTESKPEESEAIEKILALSLEEINKAFTQGFYTTVIRGEEKNVSFRDPFLAYACTMLHLKGENL